jgi:hypothetical protein
MFSLLFVLVISAFIVLGQKPARWSQYRGQANVRLRMTPDQRQKLVENVEIMFRQVSVMIIQVYH